MASPAGTDVVVNINGQLLQAIDSAILSDNASFTPDTDIASSIVPFNVDVASVTARLQDFCGLRHVANQQLHAQRERRVIARSGPRHAGERRAAR